MVVLVKKKAKLVCVEQEATSPMKKNNTYSLPTVCGLETVAW